MKEQPSPSSSPRSDDRFTDSSLIPSPRTCLKVENLGFLTNGPYSFSLMAGECLGVSGQSGIGKSQMLRAIADLIPHRGQISLYGESMESVQPHLWRRRVLMVPAESSWWYDTVRPHFAVGFESELFNRAITTLGFSQEVLNWSVSRLSTGEKQRLSLLRALVLEPTVLLLDEPTSGLDMHHTEQLELLIARLRSEQNTSVLWVSHDSNQLARVASRVLKIGRNSLTVTAGEPILGEV